MALRWAGQELARRVQAGARNARQIVVVIEEAEDYLDAEQLAIARSIAGEARKFGIHLIVSAKKPTQKNLPDLLDKLLNRWVGLVDNANTSALLTGQAGLACHKLTGKGDFVHVVGPAFDRLQVAVTTAADYARLPRAEIRAPVVEPEDTSRAPEPERFKGRGRRPPSCLGLPGPGQGRAAAGRDRSAQGGLLPGVSGRAKRSNAGDRRDGPQSQAPGPHRPPRLRGGAVRRDRRLVAARREPQHESFRSRRGVAYEQVHVCDYHSSPSLMLAGLGYMASQGSVAAALAVGAILAIVCVIVGVALTLLAIYASARRSRLPSAPTPGKICRSSPPCSASRTCRTRRSCARRWRPVAACRRGSRPAT